jgi:hypothetical protein
VGHPEGPQVEMRGMAHDCGSLDQCAWLLGERLCGHWGGVWYSMGVGLVLLMYGQMGAAEVDLCPQFCGESGSLSVGMDAVRE